MHIPYAETRDRQPDFRVKYRFLKPEEGGRKNLSIQGYLPHQGYKSDLFYDDDDIKQDGIYMVHPEFLDSSLNVITDDSSLVPKSGFADMWILIDETRHTVHRQKATVGRKCFFMEGSK